MTLKFLSVTILYVLSHFPFANDAINEKIKKFAQALPAIGPGQVDVARKYVANLGLVDGHPWLIVMNESINMASNPVLFNRKQFINRLADASRFTHDMDYRGITGQLIDDYQLRALLERNLPK